MNSTPNQSEAKVLCNVVFSQFMDYGQTSLCIFVEKV